jgi:glycyl-tRNA synthetase beta chain
MAHYFLELLMEEIPARMQAKAAEQLQTLFETKLSSFDIGFESVETFVTPRRLGISVNGLPSHQKDRIEEKKGPRVGSDERALQGFLESTGATLASCEQREIPGKGMFYFFQQKIQAKSIESILTQTVSEILQEFQWPKSMHWGSYAMTWVRPLRSIISLLDNDVLPFSVEDPHVLVGRITHGHRFLSPETISVENFRDYKEKLAKHFVIIDATERSQKIMEQLHLLCQEKGLHVKEDPALLQEVAGLVEWPVVLMGTIDERFMTLPPEVLEITMKTHQKYFSITNKDRTPAPYFGVISNMDTIDQGAQIVEGNERVLRARLADAEFFWVQDQKKSLEEWSKGLDTVVFHEKIGSVGDRIGRVKSLIPSCFLGDKTHLVHAETAAKLFKGDLLTGMVGEFPEVQGIMGAYYASRSGHDPLVARAIRQHYAPSGPADAVPTDPVSIALALADKIDILVSFWAAGIQPTGSKDPYALRRSALGVIRIIFENDVSLCLRDVFSKAYDLLPQIIQKEGKEKTLQSLEEFMAARFKVFLKGLGFEFAAIEAVVSKEWEGDIQKSHHVLKVLSDFLKTEMGRDLITTYRRAANIVDQALRAGAQLNGLVDETKLKQEEEKFLFKALATLGLDIQGFLKEYPANYGAVMQRLAALRVYMDAFFDKVTVQADEVNVRTNRLNLLCSARTLMESVADFSAISVG